MPIYEFKCAYCGITRESTFTYDEDIVAPICCNQSMARYWGSSVAISFKGSGFYQNDSRRK